MKDHHLKDYLKDIRVIGFDADDTLWINETYFQEVESQFCELMSQYSDDSQTRKKLLEIEINNLEIYGYGIKGFMLSLIECALLLSDSMLPKEHLTAILSAGKMLLNQPIELMPSIIENLEHFSEKHKLLMITKGDLLDQERKLEKSGLSKYFHHIEIVSEKKPEDYLKILNTNNITPCEFLMIGNSLKSDVIPLLKIGAKAAHVPFHSTWAHESISAAKYDKEFLTLENITQLRPFL